MNVRIGPRRNRWAVALAALAALILGAQGCGQQQQAAAEKETSQTLSAGTEIMTQLQNTVDTGHNKVGDKISLRTIQETRVQEVVVVPAGATINGEVTHIDPAGRVAGGAELTLHFTELVMPDGKSYVISAVPLRLKGKGDAKESALEVGGGAAAGAILGGIVGGKGSVGKGAAAGAVVGTGVAVATKGDQIVLPAGQKVKVSLDSAVTIVVKPGTTS
jgi:type IV secretion system protein VirB10